MSDSERQITLLEKRDGIAPFERWYDAIKDRKARQSILAKITRLQNPAFSNFTSVGGGVCELKIPLGPGYRVYFAFHGDEIVVLLLGGDKSSQSGDIKNARELWKEYKDEIEKHRRQFTV